MGTKNSKEVVYITLSDRKILWNKLATIDEKSDFANLYRKDKYGNIIKYSKYGKNSKKEPEAWKIIYKNSNEENKNNIFTCFNITINNF